MPAGHPRQFGGVRHAKTALLLQNAGNLALVRQRRNGLMPASVLAGAQRLEIELEPAEEAPQRTGLEPGQLDPPARDHRLGAAEQAPLPPNPLSDRKSTSLNPSH